MNKKNIKNMSVFELESEVKKHNKLYFVDNNPKISDYQFDLLVNELKSRKPDSPILQDLTSDIGKEAKKVIHDTLMLSLDKAYNEKTIFDWADKFKGDVIASPKIDGCAVSIKYGLNGQMQRAATRGDGREGEEITKNILHIKCIPSKTSLGSCEIRGEVFMSLTVFEKYKDQFANPRNLAAGAIKQKEAHKTGEYNLSFFAYDLLGLDVKTECEKREKLEKQNIPVAPWKLIQKKEIQKIYEDFLSKREKDDFETDGVVFKADLVSEQDRLGSTAHHPRYAIAYKYQGDSGKTKLIDVEWSVARNGVITPVAIVEPARLSGATVTRASLHNIGILEKLELTIGSEVLMMRRGGVIPNVESVVKKGSKSVKIPDKCPSCHGKVKREDDFLYCQNPDTCVKSKVAELEHFIKVIGADGFGNKLIAKLYESGLVTNLDEFYSLTKDDLMQFERMGDVLAEKLIKSIKEKKELPLDIFLRSLGIRELGRHASQILAEYKDIKNILKLKQEELSSIHTIGDIIAHEIVEGLKEKRTLIDRLLKHVKLIQADIVKTKNGKFSGKKFLFTGTLSKMSRQDAQNLVERNGGRIASSVTKDLDFLIIGSEGKPGSKLKKAEKLVEQGEKVKIISETEFWKKLI